jgi:predicted nucleic acid-binding protein
MRPRACLLDSDTLSELSRGHAMVTRRAREYLVAHGRLSFSAVTVFERLRGYRSALVEGKPYEGHLQAFESLCLLSRVVPVDTAVADRAASYWAALPSRARRAIGDILIAATGTVHGLAVVTRNRKDFAPIVRLDSTLELLDWTR